MKHILVLCAVVVAMFPSPAMAGANGLAISQVRLAGPGGADDEFIELHNMTSGPVPLAGWSLQYKSGTGGYPVSAKKNLPDASIPAGGYYLVANSGYIGSVIPDLSHSAFNMSGAAGGATLFLSASTAAVASGIDPAIADKLGYGSSAGNSPMGSSALVPESGKSLHRTSDTGNNSVDYAVGDSAPRNSSFQPPSDGPVEEEPPSEQEEDPGDEAEEAGSEDASDEPESGDAEDGQQDDASGEPADDTPIAEEDAHEGSEDDDDVGEQEPSNEEEALTYSDKVKISEFLPNPPGTDGGAEWVELYNAGSSAVSLAGWILDDDGLAGEIGSSAQVLGQVTIQAGRRLVIPITAGRFSLNNSGSDELRFYWPDRNLADKVMYSGTAKENQTWCRLGSAFGWCLPTSGTANSALPQPEVEEEEQDEAEEIDEEVEEEADYSAAEIRIISFLPDPEGTDSGNEKVRLKNIGGSAVDVKDWSLDDGLGSEALGSSAYRLPARRLPAGDELEITIPAGKFALNNTTSDGIRLFRPDGRLEHAVEYPKAKEGLYFTNSSGTWAQLAGGAPPADEDAGEGQVLAAGLVESTSLPRTGMPLAPLFFATLPAIWYIGGKKGIHEQARSHRRAGRQAGRKPGRG